MELSKEQTLRIYINNKVQRAIKRRYVYTTKFRWRCLSCGCNIFISYKQYSRHSIFCDYCWKKYRSKETIAQFHYMRKLKQYQMDMFKEITIDLSKIE